MHKRSLCKKYLAAVAILTILTSAAGAAVSLPSIFGDNMILQRGQPVPVWGAAAPGEKVTVAFAGRSKVATAGEDGAWRVNLDPMQADGRPGNMVISGANTLTFTNVVVGEVWLASGQSNMAMAMKSKRRGAVLNADAEIAAANRPDIRLYQAPIEAEKSTAANRWLPCTPESVELFSAVAYFYARDLHAALDVPVGVISAALGGSNIDRWIPPNGGLYQGHVKPLCPFGMRGMIWYQGESDPRLSYSNDMRTLVTRMRELWGIGDFPFFYVQIAPAFEFTPNSLPLLWQAQVSALDIPNTYMSASSDLGVNLHPRDKSTIGKRLARIALALTYKATDEEYSAPIYRSAKVEDNSIRLTFDHAKGLRCSDEGPLTWFTVAGADRVFHFADARIEGESVVVSSERVKKPVAVRFAWDKLAVHNLVNDAGLPAFPFRTDDWPVSTEEAKPFHVPITLPRGEAAADLDAGLPVLDKAAEHILRRGGREYARVSWAVAGESVLMRVRVHDSRVSESAPDWTGALVDFYISPTDTNRVRQVVFELQGPGKEMKVVGYEQGRPVDGKVPGQWRMTVVQDGEYILEAAVPFAFFRVGAPADEFLIDAAVHAAPFRGQAPEFVWTFSPRPAFRDDVWFALAKPIKNKKVNMATMKVRMHEPVLAATSAAGETRWGFYQFPALNRMPDGRILLMFADAEDASETHGGLAPSYVSDDEGGSWSPWDGKLQPVRPHFSVSGLFDGDFLVVPAVKYLNVKEAGIQLPEPAAVADVYGRAYKYRVSDLPSSAQEYFRSLPAKRLRSRGAGWEDVMVDYDTSGLLASRRENSDVLPRTFFERQLLRYRGELLYADYRACYVRADGSVPAKGSSTLIVSTDNGRTFRRRSTIATDPTDNDLMGEPHLSPTADGRLVCAIRRSDQVQKPMCITWSDDSGKTWTPVRDLFEFGVWPCLLLLGNGTLVLSYGRPGVQIAFDPDGIGENWPIHATVIEGDHEARHKHTCGYSCLLPLNDNSFLIAYSDFLYKNEKGLQCKAILTRRVQVEKAE